LLSGITRLVSALVFLVATHAAFGGWTWTGTGGNVNWSTGNNWLGGSAPTSSSTTDLTFAGSTNTGTAAIPLNQNIGNPFQLNTLAFAIGSGSFFLGGNPLAFTGITNSITQGSSNAQSIANNISAVTSSTVTLTLGGNGTGVVTMSGIIANGGGAKDYALSKSGTSTFTLSGANTYGGTTTISGGILNIRHATALGSTALGTTVASGATLQLQGGITVGSEALNINGTGASGQSGALVNVSGTNNYGGLLTLAGNSTVSSDAGILNLTNTGTVTGATFSLTLDGAGNGSIAGILGTTSGSLTKNGAGTWTLTGSNTYTGTTTINSGVLNIQKATGLGTTAGGTTVNSGAALQLQGTIAVGNETLTLNGSGIASDGALRNISGTNSFAGTITLGSASSIYSDAGTLTLSGGITNGGFTTTFGGAGNISESSVISGTGGLVKNNGGTLTLSGTNTFSGSSTLNGGTVIVNSASSLGTSGNATVNAATLDVAASFTSSSNFGLGSASSTFQIDPTFTLTANGVFSGTGTLNKTGTGTLVLGGANTFSGGLVLNAGVLSISSDSNLGGASGGITFNGGNLQVTADVTGTRAITMTLAGTFDIAIGKTIEESGVVSGNGNLSITNFGTLILSGSGSNGTGSTNVSGILSLRGTVTLGTGNLALNTGIFELGSGNLTRALGTGANQINMSGGSAGFAAYGADRIVNLGGSGATVTWNVGSFLATGQAFYFGTSTADHTVDFQNNINLNGATRSIQTLRGIGTGAEGEISGVISGNASSNLSLDAVSGYSPGSLILSNGSNSYGGTTTINAGNLLLEANATGTAGNTVLGSSATDIFLGNTTGAFDAGLLTNGAVTISRNIRVQSGNTGVITLGGNSASSSTFSGSVFLGTTSGAGKGVTLTAASGGTTTFSGVIQDPTGVVGPGLLRKSGAGTVVLSGVNTYAGGTSIDGGTLSISQSANLGANTGGLTINNGTLEITSGFSTTRVFTLADLASTFQIDPSQTFTITSVIGGSGALNKTGAGTMILSGNNTYSGGTNVSAGTLRISASDRILNASNLTVSGGTFDLQTFNETIGAVTLASGTISSTTGALTGSTYTLQSGTVSAILAGSGTITKNTSGTVTLSGVNTFTGSTTISAGTLQVNTNNALGSAASGTTVGNGAVLKLNNVNYSTAEPLTLNGSGISSSGALSNSGTSTFAGPINAATNATINAGGGTLNLTGGISKNGTTLTIAGGGTVNITTNGITGSAPNSDLVVDGTTVVLSAASSYNGPTTIQNSGVLQLGNNNVLPTAPRTAMTITGSSTFNLAGYSDGVASLTGDSTAIVRNSVVGGTSTLTVNSGSGVTSTFAGVIAGTNGGTQGNIALQKDGAGTLILTGTNTYSGTTTVNGGTLTAAAGPGNALGSTSGITVNSGGTLLLGASDQINNSATVTLAGGTFAKGNFGEGTASASGMGALTLTAAGGELDFGTGTVGLLAFASFTPGAYTLTISNWTGSIGTAGSPSTDRLIFASDQSGNLSSFSFSGYGPGAMEIALGSGYYEIVPIAPVPEPSTWIAASLALAPIGFRIVRRRRRPASKRA